MAASHSGLLNAMKEYNKSYLPAKGGALRLRVGVFCVCVSVWGVVVRW